MGYNARRDTVLMTLAALEQVLRRGGRRACTAGGGVDAALDAYVGGRRCSTSATAAPAILARCDELATHSVDARRHRARLPLARARPRERASPRAGCARPAWTTWQDAAGNQCGRLDGPGRPRHPSPAARLAPRHGARRRALRRHPRRAHRDRGRRALSPRGRRAAVRARGRRVRRRGGHPLRHRPARQLARSPGTWNEPWWDLADADGITLARARSPSSDSTRLAIGDAARTPGRTWSATSRRTSSRARTRRRRRALGVVTSIAGARRFAVQIDGEARHAGGTPYERRHDALLGASEVVARHRAAVARSTTSSARSAASRRSRARST